MGFIHCARDPISLHFDKAQKNEIHSFSILSKPFIFSLPLQAEALSMIKPVTHRVEEPSPEFIQERDACTKYFDNWSENNQVLFLEYLLSRMCHYQHGQINTFLKPMLQRDFISALPGNNLFWSLLILTDYPKTTNPTDNKRS